ncbi:MAG: hypothetical protein H6741_01625 [Alphaproteobacteria bacterium]|nr:hypothetical protein [Alphaproteobacteria bacterium]
MRGARLLLCGLAACTLPRSPTDDRLYIDAIAGGLDPLEAVGRCDRIGDPDLRGECILGLVETESLADAQLCETLYPGSRWRSGCFYAVGGLRELRAEYRWTLCAEQAGELARACQDHVLEVSLSHLHRGRTPPELLARATQEAIEQLELPEEAIPRAWSWTWSRWHATQRVMGFEPCAALEGSLAEACEAGTAQAIGELVLTGILESPQRAAALCDPELALVGFRPVDGGPKLADSEHVANVARASAEGWCRSEGM